MKNKLIIFIISFLAIVSTIKPANTDTATVPYYMFNAASNFNIDVGLLYAICSIESKCRARAINFDDATAANKALGIKEHSLGMFQIKLATAKSLGFKGSAKELRKPETNTWYAAKLLRHLFDRYGSTYKAISAYNAGRYIRSNKEYVNKVFRAYVRYHVDKRI